MAQLYLNCESTEKWQIKVFQAQQEKSNRKKEKRGHQVYVQMWQMKDTSSELYLHSIEIHAPTLDSDIDGTSNNPNHAHQEYL